MRMNRRNVLLGLGAIATGGGAMFGSGAFSQVTANRTMNVDAAGDASAFLSLGPASANTQYVQTTDGTLQIDINETVTGSNGQGINYDAMTFVEPLFDITNNGDQTLGIRIDTPSTSNASVNNDTSTEDSTGGSITVNTLRNNTANIDFNFYTNTSGTISSDSTFTPLSTNQNNGIVSTAFNSGTTSYTDVNIDPNVTVEVGLGIDTLGITSSSVSPDTELLSEIRVVASVNGV